MADEIDIAPEEVESLYLRLKKEAEAAGYNLNPDEEFTRALVRGLLVNEKRYGYRACPCRLASGCRDDDLDIVCPCDYRDADLDEFGACYCGLYVSGKVARDEQPLTPIPERRRKPSGATQAAPARKGAAAGLSHPVYRCRVCGYLCARDEPPEVCPICKAKKERFERFM
jgi:ferredoxin-thioredoxin reductase catalytic subunit